MQEDDVIKCSNKAKLIPEAGIKVSGKTTGINITGANPKYRMYPKRDTALWIDVPVFV